MPLAGKAAIAMWWDMASAHRDEFEDWHSHEHFPERMGIPGFRRGARWASADGGDGFFVMYELEDYGVLTSPGYLERLNNPTPWSTKLMPHHSAMVRSQCKVLQSTGGGIGRCAMTLRLSPAKGRQADLRAYLAEVAAWFVKRPGGVACHLLRTETPELAATREQEIRGGKDGAADWIVVAVGYRMNALRMLGQEDLGAATLEMNGASGGALAGFYELAYAAACADLREPAG